MAAVPGRLGASEALGIKIGSSGKKEKAGKEVGMVGKDVGMEASKVGKEVGGKAGKREKGRATVIPGLRAREHRREDGLLRLWTIPWC